MAMIYKAPPTAQGQWVSAYDKRKDFIYEKNCFPYRRVASDPVRL